jgi:hypothetical protein
MANPAGILDDALRRGTRDLSTPIVKDADIAARIELVARSRTGAGIRFLLACALAKADNPGLDIRKPYSEIGGNDSYSGRSYDETYITSFINQNRLPCNVTTAFLTPAFRTKNYVLTQDVNLGGKPPILYHTVLQLLADVQEGRLYADDLLAEAIRILLLIRDENRRRIENQLDALREAEAGGSSPLSSEGIIKLIEQHIASPNASRLPVLIIAAIYETASNNLGERILALQSHNAADEQTGSMGDVEITLTDDEQVVTSYEMKMKRVTVDDIDRALQKIGRYSHRIDNYIFITTDVIEDNVREYALEQYARTGGTEIVVLDCVGFLRHFLHLFHRLRIQFLESYQELVLAEPESAVRQELKETLLTLRRAAET